jgi:hypothetical protein
VADGGGIYEFGWLRGYSTCPGASAWRDRPTTFFAAISATGAQDCGVIGLHPSGGQFHTMVAYDSLSDGTFRSYLDGSLVANATKSVGFIKGTLQLGSERSNTYDDAAAKFNQVSENHASNSWTLTEHLAGVIDTDPDFKASIVDGNTARVISDP